MSISIVQNFMRHSFLLFLLHVYEQELVKTEIGALRTLHSNIWITYQLMIWNKYRFIRLNNALIWQMDVMLLMFMYFIKLIAKLFCAKVSLHLYIMNLLLSECCWCFVIALIYAYTLIKSASIVFIPTIPILLHNIIKFYGPRSHIDLQW